MFTLDAVDTPRWRSYRRWSRGQRRCRGREPLQEPTKLIHFSVFLFFDNAHLNTRTCSLKTLIHLCSFFDFSTCMKATVRIAQKMSCSGSLHSNSNKLEGGNSDYSNKFSHSSTSWNTPMFHKLAYVLDQLYYIRPSLTYLPLIGCWSSLKSKHCSTSSTPFDPFANKELFRSKVLFTVAPLSIHGQ